MDGQEGEPVERRTGLADLPREVLTTCLGYVGPGHHRYVAGACGALRGAQLAAFPVDDDEEDDEDESEDESEDEEDDEEDEDYGKWTFGTSIASSLGTIRIWEEERDPDRLTVRDCEGERDPDKDKIMSVCTCAAWIGNVEVLLYLKERYDAPWHHYWAQRASEGGHLNVLEIIRSSVGFALWKQNFFWACVYSACGKGQFDVLKWAMEDERAVEQSKLAVALMPIGGSDDHSMLRWCLDKHYPMNSVLHEAVTSGNLGVLQILHDYDKIPKEQSDIEEYASHALKNGRVDVLEWARDHGYLIDRSVFRLNWRSSFGWFSKAIYGGHLSSVEWLRNEGCEWDETCGPDVCAEAAYHGHLEILQWLREKGCPWDYKTIACARHNEHDDVDQWATENGCPAVDYSGEAEYIWPAYAAR